MPTGRFDAAEAARQRVDDQQESGSEQHRRRQQPVEIRADQHARDVRHHQADPADDAGDGDDARGHQRRRRNDDGAQAADIDPERPRLVVAERKHADAPALQHQRHDAEQHQRRGNGEIGKLDPGEAAQQPERDGRELIVGIGKNLHERNAGAGECADDDARQYQHQGAIMAA
jgi:hypothetical protein